MKRIMLKTGIILSLTFYVCSGWAFTVNDSLGQHKFVAPAQKVVTLNWGATEEVIELGVVPLGIADINGYQEWVVHPQLPQSQDVGSRSEPNLEVLYHLKPDLIIIGSGQKQLLSQLQSIAPVLYFDNFRKDHNNIQAIDASFIELARALGKEQQAIERLDRREKKIKQLSDQLHKKFGSHIPETTLIRFASESHVRVYGKNSTVEAALKKLGIKSALDIQPSQWGQVQRPITDLSKINNGIVLYVEPFQYEAKLKSMPLWRYLPFVQKHHVGPVGPVWTYGGSISIEYIAKAITHSLLNISY
ncbi:ABC transporter substrate-binding protein [Vibrio salinus]|uniref:ABC transporter substrate-binding protein n=1 Tax=Vibrio salinus TaxID=2899784 RepID=UPI001E523642|nr:iron-siderophore ABC transporter substrate-binding protein [Vibrio salinus]MCE0496096.1 iron-siderophore ABC transporter substrate-binding protein [Vibrio salinus]